jgi:hypothetical protein
MRVMARPISASSRTTFDMRTSFPASLDGP